jgi:hypothetical protein
VRLTPNVDGERSGEVIPFGTEFESTKSLYLDGVNYVLLDGNNRGWVFQSLMGRQVLEELEVIRTPRHDAAVVSPSPPHTLSHSLSHSDKVVTRSVSTDSLSSSATATTTVTVSTATISLGPSLSSTGHTSFATESPLRGRRPDQQASSPRSASRVLTSPLPKEATRQAQQWRTIRAQMRACASFAAVSELVRLEQDAQRLPPATPEPGPARSAWMASTCALSESDRRLTTLISAICGVARQCADTVSDTSQLESHLWIMCHLGAKDVEHVLRLADVAAQDRFERISFAQRDEVLSRASEVAGMWSLRCSSTTCATFCSAGSF